MHYIREKSISRKLIIIFMYTSFITMIIHTITCININHIIVKLDGVYDSNSNLSELSRCIREVQNNMYTFLNVKSSDSLESYYISVQNLRNKIQAFNDKIIDSRNLMMERHIRWITEEYIEQTEEAVQAKRGRNIRKYNESYNEASKLSEYMKSYIENLNSLQFEENSTNYKQVRHSLNTLELFSTLILTVTIVLNIFILIVISRQVTGPLIHLSRTADKIAAGELEIELPQIHTGDEVEVLSNAFNKMIISIKDYIEKIQEQMAIESKMKENELIMENYLKDAKLKYLQAQINPHFLFNTLNAGVQLAMIEGAEQTSTFIENMAEFFRYSLVRAGHETTIEEELKLVDHYIYILNVRFGGEVNYEKQVDESVIHVKVPSMILQPIVENVFQYGIRDIEWEGKVGIHLYKEKQRLHIEVQDNGRGMTQDRIREVIQGETKVSDDSKTSNGIGLSNVIGRLRLYYNIEDVITIESQGINKGTKVIISIPLHQEGDGNV